MARAAPKVTIEVRGDKKAVLDLHELGVRARDVRPASRRLFRVFEQAEEAQFESHRGWPPLADATLAEKAASGFPAQILVRTGALRASLTESGGSGTVREVRFGVLEFGTSLPYAKYALGTKRQPSRPLIKLRRSDTAKLASILTEYIVKGRT